MIIRHGNQIRLLQSGDQYFPALEAEIEAARREIYLESYIFEADGTGLRIAQALMRAARRGVKVFMLVDGFGSRAFPPALRAQLHEQGVNILVYRPEISYWGWLRRHRLRRLHRKLVVIDAQIGFCGGINIIDDRNTPGHTPPRFDYAVRVQGPLLADMHRHVRELWTRTSWLHLRPALRTRPAVRPDMRPRGTQGAAFLVRDNLRHRHDIEQAYLDAIGQARREVIIACAYFLPRRSFRDALREAAQRGVQVILLLQGRVEYILLHYASRALYRELLEAGIEIHEYVESFLHAKVAVVDDNWATVGSSNLDPLSFLLAREANVLVFEPGFAQELRASLRRAMKSGARVVHREAWRQNFVERTLTGFSYGIVRLLMGLFGYAAREDRL